MREEVKKERSVLWPSRADAHVAVLPPRRAFAVETMPQRTRQSEGPTGGYHAEPQNIDESNCRWDQRGSRGSTTAGVCAHEEDSRVHGARSSRVEGGGWRM
jgi:hypothetical protein